MVNVQRIEDIAVHRWLRSTLQNAGYGHTDIPHGIRLEGVGSQTGDRSVDLDIEILVVDEIKLVRFHSRIRSRGGAFQLAALAATRGNRATLVPRFEVEEEIIDSQSIFHVSANLHLYAEHLSHDELIAMINLFLNEVDTVDNELVSIIEGGA